MGFLRTGQMDMDAQLSQRYLDDAQQDKSPNAATFRE